MIETHASCKDGSPVGIAEQRINDDRPGLDSKMKEHLGRFTTYFCIVISIYGALEVLIDLPGEGPRLWLDAFLFSLVIALSVLTFQNLRQ